MESVKPDDRAAFLGVPMDLLTMSQTLGRIRTAMTTRTPIQHVALNVAKLVSLTRDSELRADVVGADMVGIDGMGIVVGARMMGIPVPERVPGVDLMERVIGMCAAEGFRPYFLGARPEVLQRAVDTMRACHPALVIAGYQHGYFADTEEAGVVAAIRAATPDCLFIGMPTPRKERFMAAHRQVLDVPFIMGVGGGIDILAGLIRRAPGWMQRIGLEWLYRTVQEPRRMWRRYLTTNAAYAVMLGKALLTRRPD